MKYQHDEVEKAEEYVPSKEVGKLGLYFIYHTHRRSGISVLFQYEAMRRDISIYPPYRDLHMLNLRFLVWRQFPEYFFRILVTFNFGIYIHIWMSIRGVRTSPASATSTSTTTTATMTSKATTTAKSSSNATAYSYFVYSKCSIIGIVLTCASFHIFELDKTSTEQILEFIKSLFRN